MRSERGRGRHGAQTAQRNSTPEKVPAFSPDRRRARRYRLVVPVEFPEGRGTTRNVSESGILVETDQPFARGAPVRFVLLFSRGLAGRGVRLHAQGRAARLDRAAGGAACVAATIEKYTLEILGWGLAPGRGLVLNRALAIHVFDSETDIPAPSESDVARVSALPGSAAER